MADLRRPAANIEECEVQQPTRIGKLVRCARCKAGLDRLDFPAKLGFTSRGLNASVPLVAQRGTSSRELPFDSLASALESGKAAFKIGSNRVPHRIVPDRRVRTGA